MYTRHSKKWVIFECFLFLYVIVLIVVCENNQPSFFPLLLLIVKPVCLQQSIQIRNKRTH